MYAHFAEEFASELINVRTDTDLDRSLALVSRRLGFDHFALSLELRSGSCEAPGLLLHDYPDEWAKVYLGFDLAGQDPVRRACDKSFIGFAWGTMEELIPLTRGDRQMLAVGREASSARRARIEQPRGHRADTQRPATRMRPVGGARKDGVRNRDDPGNRD